MASKTTSSETLNPGAESQEQDRVLDSTREENIMRRAYELYLDRGGEPGHDLADRLQAERELTAIRQKQSVSSAVVGADGSYNTEPQIEGE